jgi:hypothetical protein
MKFHRCLQEQAVYRKVVREHLLIIAVYVDDLFVTGTSKNIIHEFKKGMTSKFEMSDLGKLTTRRRRDRDKTRRVCPEDIKRSRIQNSNSTHIPMEPGLKLSKNKDEPEVNAMDYRKIVGCL